MTVNHFKREAKIMAWLLPGLVVLALVAGLVLPKFIEQKESDRPIGTAIMQDYRTIFLYLRAETDGATGMERPTG